MTMIPYKPKYKMGQLVEFTRSSGDKCYGFIDSVTFLKDGETNYGIDLVNAEEIVNSVPESNITKAYRDDT